MATKSTEQVLAALNVFATAHAEYRAQLTRVEQEWEQLKRHWRTILQPALGRAGRGLSDDDADDLDRAADAFLVNPDEREFAAVWPQQGRLLGELVERRFDLEDSVEAIDAQRRNAENALRSPQSRLATELRHWLDRLRNPATEGPTADEFGGILHRWRTGAVNYTTREAAQLLEISPSAIVRYEKGSRLPSLPIIAEVVDKLATRVPLIPDTPLRQAAFQIVRMFDADDPHAAATAFLERHREANFALREDIEDALDELDMAQLRAVAALVTDRLALDALMAWTRQFSDDPLHTLHQRLVAAGVEVRP